MSILINDIQEKFNKVIQYSQYGIEKPQTDELFKNWSEMKKHFYKLFGNQLIWEYPEEISFEIDEKSKEEKIMTFKYDCQINCGYALAEYINVQKKGFYSNKVVEDYEYNGIKITKGTKLVKTFKYFIEGDPKKLNKCQSKASELIQEAKVKGTLCLSIHPLDFLSLSENNHNWHSCHALDGEYRAGNLSYMADDCTIICYLKSKEETKLPNFPEDVPWNDKKWRVLLYFNSTNNMCFAGRQYPFALESGMNWIVDNIFNKLFMSTSFFSTFSNEKLYWSHWTDEFTTGAKTEFGNINFPNKRYVPFWDGFQEFHQVIKDAPNAKQFNDVLNSSFYSPSYCCILLEGVRDNVAVEATTTTVPIEVGHSVKCLRCGKEEILEGEDTLMCYDCELKWGGSENNLFGYCWNCDSRIPTEQGVYAANGELYCYECAANYLQECDECEELYNKESLISVDNNLYCPRCAEK